LEKAGSAKAKKQQTQLKKTQSKKQISKYSQVKPNRHNSSRAPVWLATTTVKDLIN
jgi:hypothetical protein